MPARARTSCPYGGSAPESERRWFPITPLTINEHDSTTLTPEELEIVTPTCIGPTWRKDSFGQWLLPEFTLGWEIIGWCAEWLLTPDKTPWQFTPEQMRFVLWWYAVDETGEFVYRTGVLQRMKGWG